jgi:hypothetical protein
MTSLSTQTTAGAVVASMRSRSALMRAQSAGSTKPLASRWRDDSKV